MNKTFSHNPFKTDEEDETSSIADRISWVETNFEEVKSSLPLLQFFTEENEKIASIILRPHSSEVEFRIAFREAINAATYINPFEVDFFFTTEDDGIGCINNTRDKTLAAAFINPGMSYPDFGIDQFDIEVLATIRTFSSYHGSTTFGMEYMRVLEQMGHKIEVYDKFHEIVGLDIL